MPAVLFNNVKEFLEELVMNASTVEQGIVRFSYSFHRAEAFTTMFCIAGYVVDRQVIELKFRVSSYFHMDMEEHRKVAGQAELVEKEIRDAAAKLNLTVRSGVFTNNPTMGG